jgi:hypothetical protein
MPSNLRVVLDLMVVVAELLVQVALRSNVVAADA